MSLGTIIRQQREQLGMTQDRLATSIGISKPYLSNIETGKVKNPPADRVLEGLERELSFPAGQLMRLAHLARTPRDVRTEHEQLEAKVRKLRGIIAGMASATTANLSDVDIDDDAVTAGMAQSPQIPVLETNDGYPRRFLTRMFPAMAARDYIRCIDMHDPEAFALRVFGDQMVPDYGPGDLVVISLAATPRSGDDCFFRFKDETPTTFLRYFAEPDGSVRLQPLNVAHAARVYQPAQIASIWPAVIRLQFLRR